MNNLPLISIITIVKNQEKYLEDCIQSVMEQTYPHIEYIIIDGQSTDNTVEIIKKYQKRINFWVSEPDNGISDAMNKGLNKATGDFVLFIHGDDYLINPNCIQNVVDKINSNQGDILAFGILFETPNSKKEYYPIWDARMYLRMKLPHQGIVCKRQLFKQFGNFDTTLKISMDYDFFLSCYINKQIKVLIFSEVLAVMRDTGISSRKDWKSLKKRFDEEKKIHFKYCKTISGKLFYHLFWLFYLPYRFVLTFIKK
jgi:glycosyltransferase involved in cell wall biosynthesis